MSDETREPTPTEWLVMEVLAARHQLGEQSWPFPNALRPTLRRLAERDWVAYKGAVVEGHQQVWLRTDGKAEWGVSTPGLKGADGSGGLFDHPPAEPLDVVAERERRWWHRRRQ